MAFVPIIGDANNPFGSIAQQQTHWTDTNLATDAANIQRFNAAQTVQNNYLAQLAQMQRADAEAQQAAQERAATLALNAAANQRQQNLEERRFRFAQKAEADRMSEAQADREASLKANQQAIDLRQKDAEQRIEQAGQAFAATYLTAKNNADAALEQAASVDTQIKDLQKEQDDLNAKGKKKTPEEEMRLPIVAQRLRELQKLQAAATTQHQRAENAFQALDARIRNAGFNITDEDIVHEATGKKWTFKKLLQEAKQGTDAATSPFPTTLTGAGDVQTPSFNWPAVGGFSSPDKAAVPVTEGTVTNPFPFRSRPDDALQAPAPPPVFDFTAAPAMPNPVGIGGMKRWIRDQNGKLVLAQ